MTTITEHVEIVEIARDVWSSLLGMTLEEVPASDEAPHAASVTATIHITGMANVSLALSGSRTLAVRSAAMMFDLAEADLTDEEVADAFGEIANIIAGNLKALLPEPSELSLPTVGLGRDLVISIPGARLLERIHLESEGEPLCIAQWACDAAPDASRHDQTDPSRSDR